MSLVRPRALVHVGRVVAAGVLLDHGTRGLEEARRRALALWEPGVRILEVPGGLFVRFPRPRPLETTVAPGLPVVEASGRLATAPLSPAELKALEPPPGAIVTVRAGTAFALLPGRELDPSEWLGLDPEIVAVEALGEPPPPPAPMPAPPPGARELLAVPQLSKDAVALAAALRAGAPGAAGGGAGLGARVVMGAAGAVLAVSSGVRRGWDAVRRALAGASRPRGAPGRDAGRRMTAQHPPASPGPLARALRRIRDRLLVATRVAHLAGLRQGAYMGKLLSLFEEGQLEEALRRAIPLNGRGGFDTGLALGVPRVRDALRITPTSGQPGGSMTLAPDLYAEVQRIYRRAFELLDARGEHEKAAFVLAELLRAEEEAISYLERHGRLRLAAELAESRGLAAGLVVRQWFVAGEVERAVAVARARGAYAEAVERLERAKRSDAAAALRLLWAEDLATAGDLEAAVRVARPVPQARALVERWVELAMASGGAAGHALLAVLLELAPHRFAEVRERVVEACQDRGEDGLLRRAALARGFRASRSTDAVRVLARPLLRALVADGADGHHGPGDEDALLTLAADGALRADLPPRPSGALVAASAYSPTRTIAADDVGTRPALDAAALPGGRVLAALGEGGAALLARDGRVVCRFDVPAHALVVSDTGTRALALAPRGDVTRISRLDLDARTCAPIRDLRLDGFARSYDGQRWLATAQGAVALLDVLRDDLRVLWRVDGLPGPPAALWRDQRQAAFITTGEPAEGWRYELPGLVLRERVPLEPARNGEACLRLGGYSGGRWFAVVRRPDEAILVRTASGASVAHLLGHEADAVVGLAGGHSVAVATQHSGGVAVVALDAAVAPRAGPRLRLDLEGASSAALSLVGERLTISDDRGRIVAVDLALGRITHDLRT